MKEQYSNERLRRWRLILGGDRPSQKSSAGTPGSGAIGDSDTQQ